MIPNRGGRVARRRRASRSPASTARAGSSAARAASSARTRRTRPRRSRALLADARRGPARRRGEGDLEELLAERGLSFVDYAGWEAIDAEESARGAPHGRPRVKLATLGRAARARHQALAAGVRGAVIEDAPAAASDAEPRLESAGCTSSSGASETAKAIENFPVSGEPIPSAVVRWLGRIKAASARVNAELGLLDPEKAARIAAAADRIARGELDDQFPIDVFQTGSGTSSNMNANEVIAALAGEDVHPNDDVNLGQSSNDVFPSAVHLAALAEIVGELLPGARRGSRPPCRRRPRSSTTSSSRAARTGWTPCRSPSGQEFGGYAAQVREGSARVETRSGGSGKIPLGGTAVGTGLNTAPRVRRPCAGAACRRDRARDRPAGRSRSSRRPRATASSRPPARSRWSPSR